MIQFFIRSVIINVILAKIMINSNAEFNKAVKKKLDNCIDIKLRAINLKSEFRLPILIVKMKKITLYIK